MRYIKVNVKFETSFTYEIEDDEFVEETMGEECDSYWSAMEDTIETLSDRTNQYWRDADYEVSEVFDE